MEIQLVWSESGLGAPNLWLVSEMRAVLQGMYPQTVQFVSLIVVVCRETEKWRDNRKKKKEGKNIYVKQWSASDGKKSFFYKSYFS